MRFVLKCYNNGYDLYNFYTNRIHYYKKILFSIFTKNVKDRGNFVADSLTKYKFVQLHRILASLRVLEISILFMSKSDFGIRFVHLQKFNFFRKQIFFKFSWSSWGPSNCLKQHVDMFCITKKIRLGPKMCLSIFLDFSKKNRQKFLPKKMGIRNSTKFFENIGVLHVKVQNHLKSI